MGSLSPPPLAATAPGPVDVDELRRAWRAVQSGEFRTNRGTNRGGSRAPTTPAAATWTPEPGERTLAVLGCAGSAGATTVALAVGLATAVPVRVVECASITTSGLAAASTAELGRHPSGWLQGRREHVLLERVSEILPGPHAVPVPTSISEGQQYRDDHDGRPGRGLTILDAGWEPGQLLMAESWLSEAIWHADTVVLTARPTVPGMRRLEAVFDLLSGTRQPDRIAVAMIGPRRKKWPRSLGRVSNPGLSLLLESACVEIPEVPALAVAGLDSCALPPHVVTAAGQLLAPPQQVLSVDDEGRRQSRQEAT